MWRSNNERCGGHAGNQNFPNLGNNDAPLTSSLLYDPAANTFVATATLPLPDPNSFYNTIAVLFRE